MVNDQRSNLVTPAILDEAIRCIGLKMEVRKQRDWSPHHVMHAEIAEIQTLLDWIAQQRAFATRLHARIEEMRCALYTFSNHGYGESIGGPLLDGVHEVIDEICAVKTGAPP